MNLARVAGGNEQIALAGERHGPDVFLMRIVEQVRFAVGADFVNLAVGIGGGVERAVSVEDQGVDLEPVELGEGPAFTVAVDGEDFGRSAAGTAAGGVQRAFGIDREGPEIGGGGVEDLGELGREENAAVTAQGEVGERSAFEVAAIALLPEACFHRGADGAADQSGTYDQRRCGESSCVHQVITLR